MSLKERLAAEKESALSYDNITKQVEAILVEAARAGKSSVLIYLDDEDDYKTQVVCDFLNQEGINFSKSYDVYTTTQLPYIDTHMGGYEGVDPYKAVTLSKYRFEGIRVSL